MNSVEQKESVGRALGRVASGVYIVTMNIYGEQHGLLATWVAQCAFDPPMVSVAFNKERKIINSIAKDSLFTLNVLSKSNMDIFKAFARPAGDKEIDDRFDGLKVDSTNAEGPIFPDAVSFVSCKVIQTVSTGDHVVALAQVIDGRMLDGEAEPMVHLRKSAFQY